ncbi:unnamed protein product [Lepidochelys olivacea]
MKLQDLLVSLLLVLAKVAVHHPRRRMLDGEQSISYPPSTHTCTQDSAGEKTKKKSYLPEEVLVRPIPGSGSPSMWPVLLSCW